MNIFFLGSMHGKATYEKNYQAIVTAIKAQGHTVMADHILNTSLEEIASWPRDKEVSFHKKTITGIKQADAIFAEVSHSSTSMGYLLSLAAQAAKPIVIFHSGKEEPHLFRTLEEINDKFQIIRYTTIEEAKKEVQYALEFVQNAQDTRFNFFISPSLSTYLDWIAKERKIPRSVYLRDLIERDMEEFNWS